MVCRMPYDNVQVRHTTLCVYKSRLSVFILLLFFVSILSACAGYSLFAARGFSSDDDTRNLLTTLGLVSFILVGFTVSGMCILLLMTGGPAKLLRTGRKVITTVQMHLQ